MSNTTTGRIPLWFVGTVAGLAALGLLAIFFYGSIRWSRVFTLSSHTNTTTHSLSATHNFLSDAQDRHIGFASNTSIAS